MQDWQSGLLTSPQASALRCHTRAEARARLPALTRQSPPGRALAHCPLPVTPGLLDQQSPGPCAETPEHKRLHKRPQSGKGWGRDFGQPSSPLAVTIGLSEQGGPGAAEAVLAQSGHSWLWGWVALGDGCGGGACGDIRTTWPWVPGPVLPPLAPSQLFPSLGLSFPPVN